MKKLFILKTLTHICVCLASTLGNLLHVLAPCARGKVKVWQTWTSLLSLSALHCRSGLLPVCVKQQKEKKTFLMFMTQCNFTCHLVHTEQPNIKMPQSEIPVSTLFTNLYCGQLFAEWSTETSFSQWWTSSHSNSAFMSLGNKLIKSAYLLEIALIIFNTKHNLWL